MNINVGNHAGIIVHTKDSPCRFCIILLITRSSLSLRYTSALRYEGHSHNMWFAIISPVTGVYRICAISPTLALQIKSCVHIPVPNGTPACIKWIPDRIDFPMYHPHKHEKATICVCVSRSKALIQQFGHRISKAFLTETSVRPP